MAIESTEAALTEALQLRYQPPEWTLLPKVADGTGARKRRTADAVAMNTYPSKGLELHGFEIKVSAADLRRELDDPDKADAIARYCDFWWLVVSDRKLVATVEASAPIPAAWGVLAPRGDRLVAVRQPTRLDPAPLDRTFTASLLRAASNDAMRDAAMAEVHRRAFRDGQRDAIRSGQADDPDRLERRLQQAERLEDTVRDFERRSGLRISTYTGPELGDVVRALREPSAVRLFRQRVSGLERDLAATLKRVREQLRELDGVEVPSLPDCVAEPEDGPDRG